MFFCEVEYCDIISKFVIENRIKLKLFMQTIHSNVWALIDMGEMLYWQFVYLFPIEELVQFVPFGYVQQHFLTEL